MCDITEALKRDESLSFELRALYNKYGYKLFKMSKFEAYDLYAQNKEFLGGENMITFTDNKGTLLALKPDVTLSIIKSLPNDLNEVQKICYNENVYRQQKGESFKEILQTGLECVGEIDLYHTMEVLSLAEISLKKIGAPYVLEISHMGLILAAMEACEIDKRHYEEVLGYIKAKNQGQMQAFCQREKIFAQGSKTLLTLITSFGQWQKVLSQFVPLNAKMAEAIDELKNICQILSELGIDKNIRLDFSCLNDLNYYNGIIFQGFIQGVPHHILSGGRYDQLAQKMGKNCGAIGFAISLNELDYLASEKENYDVDVLLIYNDYTKPEDILNVIKSFTEKGESVSVQKNMPTKLKYRTIYTMKNGEARKYE